MSKRIAIIGSGLAGIAALVAHQGRHDIVVLDAEQRNKALTIRQPELRDLTKKENTMSLFGNPTRMMAAISMGLAMAKGALVGTSTTDFMGPMHRGSFPPGSYRTGRQGGQKCAFALSRRAAKKAKGIATAKARGGYQGSKVRGQRR